MSGYEFTSHPEKVPETNPASSGGPPHPPPPPPKLTARDLLEPGEPRQRIFVSDYIEVRDLAELIGSKPFKVVAELLTMKIFKHADELIDFRTAAKIANKCGFIVERLL